MTAQAGSVSGIEAITDQIPQGLQAVLPANLLALVVGASVIVNGRLVNSPFMRQRNLTAYLDLDSKIVRGDVQRVQDFAGEHLVAGLDIGERLIAKHVENKRNQPVRQVVVKIQGAGRLAVEA